MEVSHHEAREVAEMKATFSKSKNKFSELPVSIIFGCAWETKSQDYFLRSVTIRNPSESVKMICFNKYNARHHAISSTSEVHVYFYQSTEIEQTSSSEFCANKFRELVKVNLYILKSDSISDYNEISSCLADDPLAFKSSCKFSSYSSQIRKCILGHLMIKVFLVLSAGIMVYLLLVIFNGQMLDRK